MPSLKDYELENLKIDFRILGTTNILKSKIYKWDYNSLQSTSVTSITDQGNIKNFDFIKVNEKNEIIIENGNILVDQTIKIPSGYKVFV